MDDRENIEAAVDHLTKAENHLERAGMPRYAKYARWARDPSELVLEVLEDDD